MSVRDGSTFVGYEADLAKLIATRLGVEPSFVVVSPSTRIEKLLNGEIDLVLATMSHTVARDKVVTFIRPHYYSSPSSVFGPTRIPVEVLTDLRTQTVCVPLNTFFSTVLAENNIRMMIYDKADRLVDAVRLGNCTFIAHDQSFLRATFDSKHTPPELKNLVAEKMSFLNVPTGMGVRNEDKSLSTLIGQIVAELHQSGVLVERARAHDVYPEFLEKQQVLWNSPQCAPTVKGLPDECLGKAADLSDRASKIAANVKQLEGWLLSSLGIEFSMPMLTGQIALNFFLSGLTNSIIISIGGIVVTLLLAALFFSLMRSANRLCSLSSYGFTLIFQNTPIILLFVVGSICLNFFGSFTPIQTIILSIFVIGISNGANAAVAMRDTLLTRPDPTSESLKNIFSLTFTQVRGCLINAVKGSPIASFVGTPELLSVMVNITAFTGTRASTYVFMAIFYLLSVQLVLYLSNKAFSYVSKPSESISSGKKHL
jgi:ABC-type amino acid transport substrate-binding protein/ABC-type amino acid transport system permease subunit